MLLFSTTLSISDRLTPERFIELVIDWNNGTLNRFRMQISEIFVPLPQLLGV